MYLLSPHLLEETKRYKRIYPKLYCNTKVTERRMSVKPDIRFVGYSVYHWQHYDGPCTQKNIFSFLSYCSHENLRVGSFILYLKIYYYIFY